MGLSNTTKTDLVFKKIKGRRFTFTNKEWYEEYPGSLVFLHANEVWADTIPTPAPGASNSIVQYYDDLKLTEDTSTPDHKAWLACETYGDPNTILKEFVPPRFHQSYTVRLYEDDGAGNKGSEVPTTHESNWFFDYENGVLVFENNPYDYGLTGPFHIQIYRYIGQKVTSGSGSVSKLRGFLMEASVTNVSSGSSSVDVTSQMSGKTPNGSETQTGVVTTTPHNKCPILTHPDRDEVMTEDGAKVYGRLTESSGTWTLSFYYLAEDGTETSYTFDNDTNIVWGYTEVFDFDDWPVFDSSTGNLPSDVVVGDMPEATTSRYGKVIFGEDNEITTNKALRTDDVRSIKLTDFAMSNFNADGSNITFTIGAGVYTLNGDKTTSTNLSIAQAANTYYLVYVNLDTGNVTVVSDTTPPTTPSNCQALYRFSTDGSGNVSVIEDVRPVYAMGVGGGTGKLGTPTDGTYEDGLLDFTSDTPINDAIDGMNEVLKYLAPEDAHPLSGNIVWSNTFASGKISDGVTLNYLTAGSSINTIFKDNQLNGQLPNPSTMFNKADSGILRIFVNGSEVDNFDLGSHFNESERAGDQSYPPAWSNNGYLQITAVGWYNNFPLWQKGNANVQVTGYSVGDIRIKVSHDVNGDNSELHDTNEFTGFYDNETARPAIASAPTVTEDTPQLKYLSGIRFYTLNSTFKVSGQSDNKLFEYTYVDNPILLSLAGMDDVPVSLTDTSVSGVSNPPVYNEQMTITDKVITLDANNQSSDDAKLTMTPRDPWGNGTAATESITDKRLINTYSNVATELIEYFHDENYRLPDTWNFDDTSSGITGNWDSTSVLTNGNAQVFNGRLIYPHINYTSGYLPTQQAGTDYSGFNGDQVYYRAIQQSGTPHNSGTLRLLGITSSDIGTNVEIYIKLPTQTGWLSLQADYNAATFTGADGDGARTSLTDISGGVEIGWTAGTYTTANSGYRYYVKVVMKNTSKEISELAEIGW